MLRKSLLLFCAVSSIVAVARIPEQNIVIVFGYEEYEFVPAGDKVHVKNTVRHEYEATRRAGSVQPHVFYNDVIKLDKASGGKAQYKNVNSPSVFHDDSKVCFFDIYLRQKGKKAKVEFKRTWTDAAFLSRIVLTADCPVAAKSLKVKIPASMPDLRLVDLNFPEEGIVRTDERLPDGGRVITYSMAGLRPFVEEPGSPSVLKSEPTVIVAGYFPDVDSLYRWHHELGVVDTSIPGMDALLGDICKEAGGRREKIEAIYRWVQRNIRYVAYEEGEAGFRPDTPAEVVRKRYGDCKGMALLLSTLLSGAGIEAYPASVGTRQIPFGISDIPCLAANDHMVCVVPEDDGVIVLDATNEYIPAGHVPFSIQGKDALVDMGAPDRFSHCVFPKQAPSASSDSIGYDYTIGEEGVLEGCGVRKVSGDMKEYFVGAYERLKTHLRPEFLKRAMSPSVRASISSDTLAFDADADGGTVATLEGRLKVPETVVLSDGSCYVDLNTASDPFIDRVDTDGRVLGYALPFPCRIVRTFSLRLPDGAKDVNLPDGYRAETPNAVFSCTFSRHGDMLTMEKWVEIHDVDIPLEGLPEWNSAVSAWKDACGQQIEIITN